VKHQMTLLTLMTLRRYIAVVAVLCHPLYLAAQTRDDHKIQIFGGYSYFLTDHGGDNPFEFLIDERERLHGFAVQAARGLNGFLNIAADVSRHSNTFQTLGSTPHFSVIRHSQASLWCFAFGPQVKVPNHRLRPFAHALFGGARFSVTTTFTGDISGGFSESQTKFAMVLGGGLDIDVSNRFAVRVIQADYLRTFFIERTQDTFRYSAGVVFKF
jgi:opacity protein-like surface antigen